MLPATNETENERSELLVSAVEDLARKCSKCSLMEVNSEMFDCLLFSLYRHFLGLTYYSFDITSCSGQNVFVIIP